MVICLQIPHSIFRGQNNFFCQLLNVHEINDIRQIELHTADPLVPEANPFEVEVLIVKL